MSYSVLILCMSSHPLCSTDKPTDKPTDKTCARRRSSSITTETASSTRARARPANGLHSSYPARNRPSLLVCSSDGLPLTLGVSFQYRYMPDHLLTLYLTYKGEVLDLMFHSTSLCLFGNHACTCSVVDYDLLREPR